MSGRPGGASGMSSVAQSRRDEHRAIADRPDAQRAVVTRSATTAPTNDDTPPTPRDEADRPPGSSPRSSSANRKKIAPKTPHSAASEHRREGERAEDRVVARRAAGPGGSRRRTGSRSAFGGGGGFRVAGSTPSSTADTRKVTASTRIAIGPLRSWTRKPLMPNAGELGDRAARRRGRCWPRRAVALDDRRQVGVVGRVEERGQDRGDERRPGAAAQRVSHAADERDRDRREQDGPPEVGPDEDRPPPQPIDPRARDEAERPASATQVDAAEHGRPRSRPRRGRGSRANGRAIRVMSEPKIETVAADQTRTKAWFCQSGDANGLRTMAAAYVASGPSAPAARPAGPCATLRTPRCVRTRAPPDRPRPPVATRPALTNTRES